MFPRYRLLLDAFVLAIYASVLLFCWCFDLLLLLLELSVLHKSTPLFDGVVAFIWAHMQNAPHTYFHIFGGIWWHPMYDFHSEKWSHTDHCETNRKATHLPLWLLLLIEASILLLQWLPVVDDSAWKTWTIENPEVWSKRLKHFNCIPLKLKYIFCYWTLIYVR